MATQPQGTVSGEVWSSLVTAGKYPLELRKRGVDEATKLTFLTRKYASFTWMLHNNFKSSVKIVNDRVYQSREISELDRFYTVLVASGAGSDAGVERVIGVSNAQGVQIKVNDMLYIKGLYAKATGDQLVTGQVYPDSSSGVLGANIGPTLNTPTGMHPTNTLFSRTKGLVANEYFADLEPVRVVANHGKDSYGTGKTKIVLERAYMGPSAYDLGGKIIRRDYVYGSPSLNIGIYHNINSGNGDARIRVGDVLLRGMPSFLEGTNYPTGVYKNPISDINFTQLYKYAVEKTLESDIPALFIKERPFDINKWMVTLRVNRDREYSNLLGRKGVEHGPDNKEIYLMGGVREFIPKDADHYIVYPSADLTWTGLLDLSVPLLELCNSGEMWGITGPTLDIALRKSFWNSNLFYNKEESAKFYMEVKTIMLAGIKINLLVSQIWEEAGFGNELTLLDMSYGDTFVPVTNQGWDMKVDKDIAEPGSNLYKEGIQGMFGLQRRRSSHLAIIDFSNAVRS